MEEKYFWPLVGVALGWFLTFVTANLKERSERLRRIGILLSLLIVIRNEVRLLIKVSDKFFEHIGELEQFEFHRKRASNHHLLEPASQLESFNKAISDFSGDHPLHSLRLNGLINSLLKVKAASFTEAAKKRNCMLSLFLCTK